ncbi:MAG: glycosyltransferase family 2 protein [Bryobacteraceae bacterium]|nr:glycosyltransferase family 2 protein [Bryobacteraceae bacterium]
MQPSVTAVVPSLACDANLKNCVASLLDQDWENLIIVVIDNSGSGKARVLLAPNPRVRIVDMPRNAGFGAAVNRGIRECAADYYFAINDDAFAAAGCIRRLVEALEQDPAAGMAAPKILLAGTDRLDSAGMNIARDGSSRQRGHGEPEHFHNEACEVLLPSGCAAMYRGKMLEEIGLFAEDFFLYCEDTDLGLRGRWAGWKCRFVPEARVVHRYSASAGVASALKAWLVERNRLRLVMRVFPASMIPASFLWAAARYFWHLVDLTSGHGKAAEFRRRDGRAWLLPWLVLKAHVSLLAALPGLLRQRREIAARRRISAREFRSILRRFSMPVRQVASW